MKTLLSFAAKNNLVVLPIRYKHQFGYCKRKGYDLLTKDGYILASFEPTQFNSTNEKWYLRNVHENYNGKRYISRITEKFLSENINVESKSFFVNSTIFKN